MQRLKKSFSSKGVKAIIFLDGQYEIYVKYKTPEGCNFDDLTLDTVEQYKTELDDLYVKVRTWCAQNDYVLWSY